MRWASSKSRIETTRPVGSATGGKVQGLSCRPLRLGSEYRSTAGTGNRLPRRVVVGGDDRVATFSMTWLAIMDQVGVGCQDGRALSPADQEAIDVEACREGRHELAAEPCRCFWQQGWPCWPRSPCQRRQRRKPTSSCYLGASSTEGIAKGAGATFYAGDLFLGDIFRETSRRGTAERFIDVAGRPDGRGMFADVRHELLFVAGGVGAAYVYDTPHWRHCRQLPAGRSGVHVHQRRHRHTAGRYFTDSLQARLLFVPISPTGEPGPASELPLSGPAADTSGDFNLNGITATANGKTLIVAHSGNGALYTVDPGTGASDTIAGVSVPNVDGVLLEAGRLWAVQNFNNQVAQIRLSPDLTSGSLNVSSRTTHSRSRRR